MMKKLLLLIILLPSFLWGQTNYYVAPSGGSDSNPGTISQPFATWQRGVNAATTPGDTLFIRGGTYYSIAPVDINPDDPTTPTGGIGTYAAPIVVMSYPGEWAILDCEAHCENWSNGWTFYNNAISIQNTEYYVFKDFEVQNVHQCDSVVDGAIAAAYSCNLTFEHIIMHDIGQRGYWIQGGVWNSFDGPDPQVPADPSKWGFGHADTTRFINCDVYNLCDTLAATPGNAADGWKTVHYDGNYTYWDGCRAWNYTDDAIDPNNISGGLRVIKNCWAMPGYTYTSIGGWDVERNGFKCSGALAGRNPDWSNDSTYLIIENCIAYRANQGFLQLNYTLPTQAEIYNNTAFGCGISYVGYGSTTTYPNSEKYHNNISYEPTSLNAITQPYHVFIGSNQYTESHNTWTWRTDYPYYTQNSNYTLTSADFVSVDTVAIWNNLTAPRQADGSLPTITTLALSPTSDLIDGGVDVGISYAGLAPDLGAIEYVAGSPIAQFSASSTSVNTGVTINFDASASSDDGSIVSYDWTFGDSQTATGVTPSHSYSSAGTYTAQLTVTDDEANTATASTQITVTNPPAGLITNMTELQAALVNDASLELSGNIFAGDLTIDESNVTITAANGFTPVFSGNVTIAGHDITLTDLTFNNTLTLNAADAFNVQNCTFTTTGIVFDIPALPSYDGLLKNYTINNNTYTNVQQAIFGRIENRYTYSFSQWRIRFGFDRVVTVSP